jgi:hypothetical protein
MPRDDRESRTSHISPMVCEDINTTSLAKALRRGKIADQYFTYHLLISKACA